jgi:hypothetical protein
MSNPTARNARRPAQESTSDDRINEAFHGLLRAAAEQREERQQAHALKDAAAAKQQSLDLLSLARRYATEGTRPTD